MADDEVPMCVAEAPWWLDVDRYDQPDVELLVGGDLVAADEVVADSLSVSETLLAASLAGPGPVAQRLLGSLTRLSPSQDQWLTCVQLWEAQEAWLAGQKALAVAGFAGAEPVTLDGFRDDEALTLELALGVGCSDGFAHEQITTARLLSAALSRTGDLLRAGRLSPYRARLIVAELGHLHPDVAQAVEAKVIGTAAEVPTGALRKTMVRHTKRLDRQAVNEAKVTELAHKTPGRRVVFDPDAGDGLVGLYAYLPPVEGLAMRAALKAAAGVFRTADGRCQDEREADALTGMVLGFDPDHPGFPVPPKVKVGLLIDLATLLRLRDSDGELLGYGHLPAEVAREIADRATSWHRLVYDPVTGHLLDAGTEVHDMPALTEFIPLRDRRDRFPGGTRTTPLDLDHAVPFKPRNRRTTTTTKPAKPAKAVKPAASGKPKPDSPVPADQATTGPATTGEAHPANSPATPAGKPVDAVTPTPKPGSEPGSDPTATSALTQAAAATAGATITSASASPANDTHPADRTAPAHRTAPAAGAAPADRTAPADSVIAAGSPNTQQRGHTSADNLAALTRRHHRAKTFLNFTYRHLGHGVLEWTTPLGRIHHTYPHDYRPEGDDDEPPDRVRPS